ncbi:MAG: hypothetical protein R2877_06065 [Bdellovibrionota bacterium]
MKKTEDKSTKSSLIRLFVFTIGFAVLFHCFFFWATTRGKVLRFVNNSDHLEFSAQKQMLQIINTKTKFDILFIGDEVFIERMRSKHPDCNCAHISVPFYQLVNVGDVLRMVKKDQFKTIFIQSEPHFWTNLGHTNPMFYLKQDATMMTTYLKLKKSKNIFTLLPESIIFDLPRQLLWTTKYQQIPLRSEHLEILWFRPNPKNLIIAKINMQRLKLTNFFWVMDTSFNFKSRTDLPKRLKDFAKGDTGEGKIIDYNQVAQYMKGK